MCSFAHANALYTSTIHTSHTSPRMLTIRILNRTLDCCKAWFFYAKGSGIWFDIGKTVVYTDHGDAYQHFKAKGNEDMCRKAAAQGYDSIQFLAHSDGGDYGDCRKNAGTSYLNIEIVCTSCVGENTCASNNGQSPLLMSGWMGAKGTCKCDNTKKNLNCAGVPD